MQAGKFDVIVIGAGAAGMTTAIYVRRAGKSVAVIEQGAIGGQIIDTPDIENYPGIRHVAGADFAAEIHEQAVEVGAEFIADTVLGIEDEGETKLVRGAAGAYEARCVVIATGTRNRHLGMAGEDELIGHGVAYTTARADDLFRGMDAVVYGGGNSALEEAEVLAARCPSVVLVYRGDIFHCDVRTGERLRSHKNIRFMIGSEVVSLLKEETGAGEGGAPCSGEGILRGVVVEDRKTGERTEVLARGLLVAIGREPDTSRFTGLVELDERGYIVAGEDGATSVPGVFAAGDCRSKQVRQVATAVADGVAAALNAVRA